VAASARAGEASPVIAVEGNSAARKSAEREINAARAACAALHSEVEVARAALRGAQGRAEQAAAAVASGDVERMVRDFDVAARAAAQLLTAIRGAEATLKPSASVLALRTGRHRAVLAVLDDDRRAEVAPAERRAERAAAQRRWTDYHARLLADPEAVLTNGS
jgi:hypothetical protein